VRKSGIETVGKYLCGDNVASGEDISDGFGQTHLVDELVRHFCVSELVVSRQNQTLSFWGK
jgi:hypothetical protein